MIHPQITAVDNYLRAAHDSLYEACVAHDFPDEWARDLKAYTAIVSGLTLMAGEGADNSSYNTFNTLLNRVRYSARAEDIVWAALRRPYDTEGGQER